MARGQKPVNSENVRAVAGQQAIAVPGMFPLKPKRAPNVKAPGTTVKLISNLFQMCLKSSKPIFKTTVTVELIRDDAKGDKLDSDTKTVQAPVKLGNEYRRKAVEKAISKWLSEHKPLDPALRGVDFLYIFDANASIVYSLFNLFPSKIDGNEKEFLVTLMLDTIDGKTLTERPQQFKVILFKKEVLDLKYLFDYCSKKTVADNTMVQEHIRAMNVILRGKISTLPEMVLTQFNVFPFLKRNQFEAGPGVIVNRGFSTSVRPAECGVVLNVANTVCSFYEEIDLINLVQKKYRNVNLNLGLSDDVRTWLKKELFNKQVEARHINYGTKAKPHYRKYRVNDICGSCQDKFRLVDKATKTSKEISIAQYFKDEYKIVLKFPKLPCVVDKGRKLPLEVCHLVEKQRVNRRMDPNETANIIKQTALRPMDHFNLVKANVAVVESNSKPLNNFGLDFDPRPIEVDGRELTPISLLAGEKKSMSPSNGQYMTYNNPFFKPATIKRWALTFLMDFGSERDRQNSRDGLSERRFSSLYCEQATKRRMKIAPLEKEYCNYISVNADEKKLKTTLGEHFRWLNKEKVDHCIFVLPPSCPEWMYRYLQYLEASTQEGRKPDESWTRTSCLQYKNYKGKILNSNDNGGMFISNLLLKYNTKLGGINFVIDRSKINPVDYHFLKGDCIFISVDVCHPAPGDKLIQSVAAVVGMWDLCGESMSYCTRLRVQKKMRENHSSTIEEVGEIDIMFGEVIERYRAKKGAYPARIIILRDGVSEGQYRIVLNSELGKVKSCLNNKYKNQKCPQPLITCLVVQKRHKVRFMRKDPKPTRQGPDFNIQPGTVVDTEVTHPTDFSFYIAPHKAIQGTSRAPHIYIICDEIKFTQDQAQAMVHVLSYLSPRCTKSTSIPTPVNLADLAAEQGKNLVISWNDAQTGKMTDEERLKKLNEFLSNLADKNYQNTLYYI